MDVNPKSIKTEELYGFISMATREWKDGLLSKASSYRRKLEADIEPTFYGAMPEWLTFIGTAHIRAVNYPIELGLIEIKAFVLPT